ncbi:MAG TPA: DUF4249 domain-containing protein [Bacteroidales bacterium]|nr:DUF4249 domain-containing protein [Bacteroidales bacterium]
MSNIFIKSLVFVTVTLSLSSCEKTVDNIKLPEYDKRLVVHSFVSPDDSLIYVDIGSTIALFEKDADAMSNFKLTKVSLYDQDKIILFDDFRLDSAKHYHGCKLKYPIVAGRTYKIGAACPGFPDAFAEFTIPVINNLNMIVDTSRTTSDNIRFDIHFTDVPKEANYYNVYLKRIEYSQQYIFEQYLDPRHYENDNYSEEGTLTTFINDQSKDGKTFSVSFEDFPYNNYDSIKYEAVVLETDADYYRYHQSLINYKSSDDLFTEFSPVYSNIKGGVGIVSSYVKHVKEFIRK